MLQFLAGLCFCLLPVSSAVAFAREGTVLSLHLVLWGGGVSSGASPHGWQQDLLLCYSFLGAMEVLDSLDLPVTVPWFTLGALLCWA